MKDIFGNEIALTEERWEHILATHPEIRPYKDRLAAVLESPDIVKKSRRDENIFMYYKWCDDMLSGKYLLVVVKYSDRNFVVTAYITDRIKEGEVVWKKS